MSQANPFWGAPRIHGELLKLGIAVAQSTVARYLPRSRKLPCQTWRTFLTNHLAQTAAIDFFTVPTATFRVLFVFVVLSQKRRRVLHQRSRTHLALGKDAPEPRAVAPPEQGRVVAIPQVGGLHHRYQRRAA
jgi:putative transposase